MSITTVLLCKEPTMGNAAISEYYLKPLAKEGIPESSVLLLPLLYNTPTKILAKTAKAYLDKLITMESALSKSSLIVRIFAPYSAVWANLPLVIPSLGTIISVFKLKEAPKAAADAEVFPVDAHIIAVVFFSRALANLTHLL